MTAEQMARNKLIGVRFSDEEAARVERLRLHFQELNPGVTFNAQTVIKAALALAEAQLLQPAAKKRAKK